MDFNTGFLAVAGMLPFIFLVGYALLRFAQGGDRTGSIIEATVAWAMISVIASELLGSLHALAFLPILVVWLCCILTVGVLLLGYRGRLAQFFVVEWSLPLLIMLAIFAVTLLIALTAAPNNWDSQAYHLPRIEHWVQNRTFDYFPTRNVRQNEFAPLAEILLLQTRILSDHDRLYLLVQWTSMLVSVMAVFRITLQLGGTRCQGWIAALFLATLPIGILESTSTQNDYVEAVFLVSFISIGIDASRQPRALRLLVFAASAGVLTGFVKPIGYALGIGYAVWFGVALTYRASLREWLQRVAVVLVVSMVLIGPYMVRFVRGAHVSELGTMHLSSSFGPKQTLDTLARHIVSNLAIGIPAVDRIVLRIGESLTFQAGLQTYRADTSDPLNPVYTPPDGLAVYHEDWGQNPLHVVLLILAAVSCVVRPRTTLTQQQLVYTGAWLGGIVTFAALFRFGLWEIRYHLPGFAAGAPVFALAWPAAWEKLKRTTALVVVMGLSCIPVLFLNQSRELVTLRRTEFPSLGRDRISYLTQTRLRRLFANQPQLEQPYTDAIDVLARSNATQFGIIIDRDNYEYAVWAMLRSYKRGTSIRIEAVDIPSETNWPLGQFTPDFVFWDQGSGAPAATLSIAGEDYRRVYLSGPILAHAGEIAVYERISR